MKVLVIATDELKEELGQANGETTVEWMTGLPLKNESPVDVCIDLLFENTPERISQLKELKATFIIVNAVSSAPMAMQDGFIRINGWPTFLKRTIIEAACRNEKIKEDTQKIFERFGKKTEWVPDMPGLITPRVVAAIINEAYFALEEKVSSKEEIDTAMKLGTNYPYGPFEWSKKIGLKKIHSLLTELADEQKRYKPAALLTKEAIG